MRDASGFIRRRMIRGSADRAQALLREPPGTDARADVFACVHLAA